MWGDRRLDTATGVFTTPGITDDVLAVLAEHRPDVPDTPVFRTSTLKPVPKDWTDFGLRALTSMSARRHVEHAPPLIFELVDERAAELTKPFVGITTDGVALAGLRERRAEPKVSTAPDHRRHPGLPRWSLTEPAQPGDVRDGRHRVAAVVQRPHEPLPARPDARGPRATAAGCRTRHRAGDPVGARVRAGAQHHAHQRAGRPTDRRLRGVRRVALLPVDLRLASVGRRRTVGLADRRAPPVRQLRRVRRPDRDDADLHGFGAAADRAGLPRRRLDVRPRGGARAGPDPLVRRTAAGAGDHPSLDPSRRAAGPPPEPRRRAHAGRGVPRQRRPAVPGGGRFGDVRRAAAGAARAGGELRRLERRPPRRGAPERGRRSPRRDLVLVVRRLRRRVALLLPGAQPGDPDRVRPPPGCRVRQRGPDPSSRPHPGAHAQRRRLRHRPPAPALRALRPHRRRHRPHRGSGR